MFLGDQVMEFEKNDVTDKNINSISPKVDNSNNNGFEDKNPSSTEARDSKDINTDNYKDIQRIRSDSLNTETNKNTVNISNYNNCQALSSDQLFGRSDNTTKEQRQVVSGLGEYIQSYEWEDKIRNAKDIIQYKSTSIYTKLKNKWNGLN